MLSHLKTQVQKVSIELDKIETSWWPGQGPGWSRQGPGAWQLHFQVYLVTGGANNVGELSSTEILISGSKSWQRVGDLPGPANGIRGVSFNNKIIMMGRVNI